MNDAEQLSKTLLPLSFILGEWKGKGQSFGQPITGNLRARMRFHNTFIEIEEKLFLFDGSLDHEDCAWISFDHTQDQLSVTHFMPPGITERKLAIITPKGFHWWLGPHSPIVYFIKEEETLLINVISPDEKLMSTMRYTRIS